METPASYSTASHSGNNCHTCNRTLQAGRTQCEYDGKLFHVGCFGAWQAATQGTVTNKLAETLTADYGTRTIDAGCVDDGVEWLACIFDGEFGNEFNAQRIIDLANAYGADMLPPEWLGLETEAMDEAETYLNGLLDETPFVLTWHEGDFMLGRVI